MALADGHHFINFIGVKNAGQGAEENEYHLEKCKKLKEVPDGRKKIFTLPKGDVKRLIECPECLKKLEG